MYNPTNASPPLASSVAVVSFLSFEYVFVSPGSGSGMSISGWTLGEKDEIAAVASGAKGSEWGVRKKGGSWRMGEGSSRENRGLWCSRAGRMYRLSIGC